MIKAFAFSAAIILAASVAHAGSGTCTDLGNGLVSCNGFDDLGNSWNSTTTRLGNGMYTTNGNVMGNGRHYGGWNSTDTYLGNGLSTHSSRFNMYDSIFGDD